MSDICKDELFRVELEAADDFRTDSELNKYCQEDAKLWCPDVEAGDGRVQDCLVRCWVLGTRWAGPDLDPQYARS